MCKIIESLNTLSKLHSILSEKMNTVMNSEIFNTSNALTTLFYLDKYKDIQKVAEVTGNNESFIMFNCNNLAHNNLVQMKNGSKKGTMQFVLTDKGKEFLTQCFAQLAYFDQFAKTYEDINVLQQSISAIDVSTFYVKDEDTIEESQDQFVVI